MKDCFRIFGFPFYFVGWLAPAYRDIQSQRGHIQTIKTSTKTCFQLESLLFGCQTCPWQGWERRSQSQRGHEGKREIEYESLPNRPANFATDSIFSLNIFSLISNCLRQILLQMPIVDDFDVACRVFKITRIDNVFVSYWRFNPR